MRFFPEEWIKQEAAFKDPGKRADLAKKTEN